MFYQVGAASGEKQTATPTDCQWYKIYLEFPVLNILKFHVVFCCRFRLPYTQFIQLLSDSKENNWFPCWSGWNSKAPLSLLILGAL
jgi:hypothetical protein